MNRVQKQKHLAQANRHIAELAVQIRRQRVIVKHALETGQRSEMAESLLDALEGSLRLFEKHRIFLLSCSVNHPNKGESSKRPDPRGDSNRRVGTCHDATGVARHDQLTNAALPAWFGAADTQRVKESPGDAGAFNE